MYWISKDCTEYEISNVYKFFYSDYQCKNSQIIDWILEKNYA